MVTQEQRDKSYANLCQALAEWRKILEEDLGTEYNGNPRFAWEDESFLVETIETVKRFQKEIGADQNTLPPE